MKTHPGCLAALTLAFLLSACRQPDRDAPAAAATTPADTTHAGHATADSMTAAAATGAIDHGQHTPAASAGEHDTHAGREAGAASHDGHAQAPTPHAQHQAMRASNADHAEHRAPRHPAQHAPAAAHDQHAPGAARADTSAHAAHAARADTTAHAGHVAHTDTAHVAGVTHKDSAAHAGAAAHADTSAHAHAQQRDTSAVHAGHAQQAQTPTHGAAHNMPMLDLGGGWMLLGMAQVFPTYTFAVPSPGGSALGKGGLYATQPAIMANLESRGSRVTLRTTLNFEGVTQPDGELTFGGWGEGFIDKRHPHTLLHELMLSANFFRGKNSFSLSAGKGFAPYGTDDPMSRPVIKYPTNHHLSQALERWTVNGIAQIQQWSLEAGIFGGAEPTGPYDFSNIESFADSWSARVTRRFGTEDMGAWPWEFSVSHAYIEETHHDEVASTRLYNGAIRHEDRHGPTHMYALFEASFSDPQHGEGFYSLLAEGALADGIHAPYGRIEFATRPEYERLGAPGTSDFFRYHHDDEPIGATQWLILTGGYGLNLGSGTASVRPYAEAQYQRIRTERGGIDPVALFGRRDFWSISIGARIFLGGEAMRMGTYGVLDAMTRMHKPIMTTATQHH